MKTPQFYAGQFYHDNKCFKNCVNTMTRNIFNNHFFRKKTMVEAIKLEADKMPKGLKQFYADLFLLTVVTKVKYQYDYIKGTNVK